MVQDKVERTLELPMGIDEAWPVLSEPEMIGQWFGTPNAELRPGVELDFEWSPPYGSARARITAVEPPRHMAFRWRPGSQDKWDGVLPDDAPLDDATTTLVELTLEPGADADTTLLRVVESGFASLPDGVAAAVLAENSVGWDDCLASLTKAVDARVPSA